MAADTFTLNVAQSLIRHATGETYGDGEIVTGLGVGYAEPGYHDDETVWVTGNWNTRQPYSRDGQSLTDDEAMPAVLANALARAGVECEWLDEWTECQECFRLVRTQPDSYGWSQSYADTEDVGPVCADCQRKYGLSALDEYLNDAHMVVTWCDAAHLESLGFTLHSGDYESGFHPGQDANPTAIMRAIHADTPDVDVVFLLDNVGQFDMSFSAYVKPADSDA